MGGRADQLIRTSVKKSSKTDRANEKEGGKGWGLVAPVSDFGKGKGWGTLSSLGRTLAVHERFEESGWAKGKKNAGV